MRSAEQHLRSMEQRLKRLVELDQELESINRLCAMHGAEVILAPGIDLKWPVKSISNAIFRHEISTSWTVRNYYQIGTSISV